MVTQGYYLEDALVAYPTGKTERDNREVNNRPPLGLLTIKVARNKGLPTSLSEAFLKEEDLGLKDLERIVGREVVAVHTYPRHLHPNEPRVGLQ